MWGLGSGIQLLTHGCAAHGPRVTLDKLLNLSELLSLCLQMCLRLSVCKVLCLLAPRVARVKSEGRGERVWKCRGGGAAQSRW